MDSNTPQDLAQTDGESEVKALETRRNWASIIVSSIFGGAVAIIAAPTIAALLPIGTTGFVVGTTITGMLGSVTTKVTGNAIDSSKVDFTVYQSPVQQFYRKTVTQYIGATLQGVVDSIRMNRHLTSQSRVFFEISDELRFDGIKGKERRRMFFEFSFKVVPLDGTLPRTIDQSIPAPDLPNYDHDSTRTFVAGANQHLLSGVPWAVVEGAFFGVVGGALGRAFPTLMKPTFIETVPGKINVIVGMSSITGAAGPIKNLTFPSTAPDHAALFVEFATEAQHQVNRLVRCALENGVGLDLDMKIGSTTDMTADVNMNDTTAAQHCQFHWDVSEKVNRP